MLSKCANPLCSASFRYLHRGKLFRVERRSAAPVNDEPAMSERKVSQRIEYYWLCEACCTGMTLVRADAGGVVVKALESHAMTAA